MNPVSLGRSRVQANGFLQDATGLLIFTFRRINKTQEFVDLKAWRNFLRQGFQLPSRQSILAGLIVREGFLELLLRRAASPGCILRPQTRDQNQGD